jgi:hypothetical protein
MENKNNKKKRKYVKPKITKIKLDATTAVLGSCKFHSGIASGPMNINCRGAGAFGMCREQSS